MSSAISSFSRKVGIPGQEQEVFSCSGSNYTCENDPRLFLFLFALFGLISVGVCLFYTNNFLGWEKNWIKLHIAVDVLLLVVCVGFIFFPKYTPKVLKHGKRVEMPGMMMSSSS